MFFSFVPGEKTTAPQELPSMGPSPEEIAKIRVNESLQVYLLIISVWLQEAIAAAKSLDEVQQLEAMLKAGQLPLQGSMQSGYRVQNGQFVEEDM